MIQFFVVPFVDQAFLKGSTSGSVTSYSTFDLSRRTLPLILFGVITCHLEVCYLHPLPCDDLNRDNLVVSNGSPCIV
jgi:hypothetical protein